MRYLLLILEPDTPVREPGPDIDDWVSRHDASGARIIGERLRPGVDESTIEVHPFWPTDGPGPAWGSP